MKYELYKDNKLLVKGVLPTIVNYLQKIHNLTYVEVEDTTIEIMQTYDNDVIDIKDNLYNIKRIF